MSRTFMRFPGFKWKVLTLSYDDGVRQDKRLVEMMQKYGVKGTFNINGALFGMERSDEMKGRMTVEEALELYEPAGMEVAIHGYKHLSLSHVDEAMATNDVLMDRKELERIFGHVIKGMAYANGAYNDSVVEILKKCGVNYARTVESTERFDVPVDWLRLPATCHHCNPHLMELAREFVDAKIDENYIWRYRPQMFYLWGHSYEFDTYDNWQVIDEFLSFIAGKSDIWYATNGEIYEYVKAYDSLEWSVEGSFVYNPSAIDVYINYFRKEYIIPAGKTVSIK